MKLKKTLIFILSSWKRKKLRLDMEINRRRKRADHNGSQLCDKYQCPRESNDRNVSDGITTLTKSKIINWNEGKRILIETEISAIVA